MKLLFERWRDYNEGELCDICLEELLKEEKNPEIIKQYKEKIENNSLITPCNCNHDHEVLQELKIYNDQGILKRMRTRKKPPRFIVIHWTATRNWQSTARVLNNRGLSTHYEIDRKGKIHEYADPATKVTFHAGSTFNSLSIGIDITSLGWTHAKKKGCRRCKRNIIRSEKDQKLTNFTSEQKSAARKLVTSLCNQFDIPQVVAPDYRQFRAKIGKKWSVKPILDNGIGIVRHRNLWYTGCPGTFPMNTLGTPFKDEIKIERLPGEYEVKPRTPAEKSDAVKKGTLITVTKNTGGRKGYIMKGYRKEIGDDFDFATFYDDLETFGGGISKELPKFGNDYTFGPEHYAAWQKLQINPKFIEMKRGIKAVSPEESGPTLAKENTFSSFKDSKKLFANWRKYFYKVIGE